MAGKILVTGATGNIGAEIVRLLKEKNADFVAATNSRSIDGVDSVALNFANIQSLEAAMQMMRSHLNNLFRTTRERGSK